MTFKTARYCILMIVCLSCSDQNVEPSLLQIIDQDHPLIKPVMDDPNKFELQIIYTQVDRDGNNHPSLRSIAFHVDDSKYFYPASTVKMPTAFLALEKIHRLGGNNPNINRNTALLIDAARSPQTSSRADTTAIDGTPTVAHYIAKVFSVSDNDAYNRLYEFVGQDHLNLSHQNKGIFQKSRIRTRVGISGFSTEDNLYTNPYQLQSGDKILKAEDEREAIRTNFSALTHTQKGQGYYSDTEAKVIESPFDMSQKNFVSVTDLEASLQRIIYPELFDTTEQYNIAESDYDFLYDMMQRTPHEHPHLRANADYYDSYVKFFLFGDKKEPMPKGIRILNKVGFAYGTLTDCSYIIDFEKGVEFFLTSTLLVNENQIFNDGQYEYDDIGIPFLAELGRQIYAYECTREKEHAPDLSKFDYRPE